MTNPAENVLSFAQAKIAKDSRKRLAERCAAIRLTQRGQPDDTPPGGHAA